MSGSWSLQHLLERHGVLPGHLLGLRRISQDEHRHVAYGTWFLQQKAKDQTRRSAAAALTAVWAPDARIRCISRPG